MINEIESETAQIKKDFLKIHKNDSAGASKGLFRNINYLMGYAREGIETTWSLHRAKVLYKAYLELGNKEVTVFEDFFDEQKKKLKRLTPTI